jgi:molybdopterin-guanine dinucleotide biosynthesis protein A
LLVGGASARFGSPKGAELEVERLQADAAQLDNVNTPADLLRP